MLSVIICCYNSASRLPATLQHLQAQEGMEGKTWEVIVVDNASKDNTSIVAQNCWQTKPVAPLILVHEPVAGLANARKKGLAIAQYELICFVDDDNLLAANYLSKVIDIMQTYPNVAACGGEGIAAFAPETVVPAWFPRFSNGYAVGKQAPEAKVLTGEKEFLYGAGMAIRKKIWEEIENMGFESMLLGRTADKITSGEDLEMGYLFRLMGYDLYYTPELSFQHLIPANRLTWDYVKKLKKGFGSSAVYHGFYKNLLTPHSFRTTIRRVWWLEFLLVLAVFGAKFILFFPFSVIDQEGNWRSASWQHSWGRVLTLWQLRYHYHQIQEKVSILAKKLQKNSTNLS